MIIIIYYNYYDSQFRNKKVFGFDVGVNDHCKIYVSYVLPHPRFEIQEFNEYSFLWARFTIQRSYLWTDNIFQYWLFTCSFVQLLNVSLLWRDKYSYVQYQLCHVDATPRQCNMQPVAQSARRTTTKNLENAKRFLIKILTVWHLTRPVDDA